METITQPAGIAEIRESLELIAEARPNSVIRNFRKGDLAKKSMGFKYEIDMSSEDIYSSFGIKEERGKIPYWEVYNHLGKNSLENSPKNSQAILDLFNKEAIINGNYRVLPFSRIVKEGVGECAEKAIAMQLCMQNQMDFYTLSGGLGFDTEDFLDFHAFNVILSPNKGPHLIDVENPVTQIIDGKTVAKPYIVPIKGINLNDGHFQLNQDSSDTRRYVI